MQSGICTSPLGGEGLIGYWNFNDGSDATIEDLTEMGTMVHCLIQVLGIGAQLDNNPLCLGSENVDSVVVSLPFFIVQSWMSQWAMIGLFKIILMEQTMHIRSHYQLKRTFM